MSPVRLPGTYCSTGTYSRRLLVLYILYIDDPELMHKGQPSVPKTLLLLRQKVERLSKPIQALRDLADILE